MKKTNLFLLLLLSNSFAFAGEEAAAAATAMEIESSDDEFTFDNELEAITNHVEEAKKLKVLNNTFSSFSLHVGPELDIKRRSSESLRASTSADRAHEERYNENLKERNHPTDADYSFTHFPRQLSNQKRGLTPPQEGDGTSDSSAFSSPQTSPQRPQPIKRIVATGKRRRLNFPTEDDSNDQDTAMGND